MPAIDTFAIQFSNGIKHVEIATYIYTSKYFKWIQSWQALCLEFFFVICGYLHLYVVKVNKNIKYVYKLHSSMIMHDIWFR
jgi:hypothetical protein